MYAFHNIVIKPKTATYSYCIIINHPIITCNILDCWQTVKHNDRQRTTVFIPVSCPQVFRHSSCSRSRCYRLHLCWTSLNCLLVSVLILYCVQLLFEFKAVTDVIQAKQAAVMMALNVLSPDGMQRQCLLLQCFLLAESCWAAEKVCIYLCFVASPPPPDSVFLDTDLIMCTPQTCPPDVGRHGCRRFWHITRG